jgi:hypothetical protein
VILEGLEWEISWGRCRISLQLGGISKAETSTNAALNFISMADFTG